MVRIGASTPMSVSLPGIAEPRDPLVRPEDRHVSTRVDAGTDALGALSIEASDRRRRDAVFGEQSLGGLFLAGLDEDEAGGGQRVQGAERDIERLAEVPRDEEHRRLVVARARPSLRPAQPGAHRVVVVLVGLDARRETRGDPLRLGVDAALGIDAVLGGANVVAAVGPRRFDDEPAVADDEDEPAVPDPRALDRGAGYQLVAGAQRVEQSERARNALPLRRARPIRHAAS